MRHWISAFAALVALAAPSLAQSPQSPLSPFTPDPHTLLLYHFDEGSGKVAADASGNGADGTLQGAAWARGKFGGGVQLDGVGASVFRKATPALMGLKRFTVECWYRQDNPSGRQFLVGKDVTFHWDLSEGNASTLSLYNLGGQVLNSEGKPHMQAGAFLGAHSGIRWNHLAACYDGSQVSLFMNGRLAWRGAGPKDFTLGSDSRGLWIGCYVGMDYWFSGIIDEVRISDVVRYDPEGRLAVGGVAVEMPGPKPVVKEIRRPAATGRTTLEVTLQKLRGKDAAGWVYLKPPGKPAAIVGRYEMKGLAAGKTANVRCDVSDEAAGPGTYILALEPTDAGAVIAATGACLMRGGKVAGSWAGRVESRLTFSPVMAAAVTIPGAAAAQPGVIDLTPQGVDRLGGTLAATEGEAPGVQFLSGDGYAEWWLHLPRSQAYRVSLRYACAGRRPCDIVIDGRDLTEYTMCAMNPTGGSGERDAFWEQQGWVRLEPGVHWLRLQDMPPNVFGIRLEPIPAMPARRTPFASYPVPAAGRIMGGGWQGAALFDRATAQPTARTDGAVAFRAQLPAGGAARVGRSVKWNLEPFGALRFTFTGEGSRHVASLRLVDAKGDEKLLWRGRDLKKGPVEVTAPLLFEGMDVFDGRHVAQVCLDLHEGNVGSAPTMAGLLAGLTLVRRDALARPTPAPPARAAAARPAAPPLRAPAYKPWTKPVVPEEHPLWASTEPKPVKRATLGYGLHFTGSRDINPDALTQYHSFYNFGDVCWPHIGILPQRRDYKADSDYRKALDEMEVRLREVERRGLFLFDIWGYVPFGEAGPTPRVAQEHHDALTRIFGDRFMGYDNGEQDGRYIGSYADRGTFTDRKGGWADFVKWDDGICADNMNYMNATGSLNYSHYYADRGARTLGLETAQGLPSDTLMFSFLRGASRQYGRLTSQATSIWNRFGYNMYHDRRTEGGGGYGQGPNKGCSLSLHKRLFFSSYTGGDSICGTEAAQFTADKLPGGANELSPLGRQHLEIAKWTARRPDRGVLCSPVAFMLDFYNGWNMPRHLYRGDLYKVWGKLPYEKSDYQIDALFRMVWPGYEDASYLRDERGFICPTPFGDIFDVLNNRCRPEILRQYAAVVMLGDVEMTPDVVAALTGYVRQGGDLVIDAAHARSLPSEMVGAAIGGAARQGTATIDSQGRVQPEEVYTYLPLSPATAGVLLATGSGEALVTVNRTGKGRVIVIGADCWMTDKLTYADPKLVHMQPPYRLLKGVQAVLSGYLSGFSPVTVSPGGLTVRTCLYDKDPKRVLVGLFNNSLFADWTGTVTVRNRAIASAIETWRGKRLQPGPAGIKVTVKAGDVAMIEVRLR